MIYHSTDWDPVRHGDTYCSPACGGGCTWKSYQLAKKRAQELADYMGSGWTPKVWENMGWHYEARSTCERLRVKPLLSTPGYHAFLNEPGKLPGGRWVGDGDTPEQAVKNAIREARREYQKIGVILDGLD